jgi:hypothetical protein
MFVSIMITIAKHVEELLLQDDVALAAAQKGLLNLSAYAREIQPQITVKLLKDIQLASIVTALSRLVMDLERQPDGKKDIIQSLAVHSNLEGITYERSAFVSDKIRDMYYRINVDDYTFLTVTQGINEITIVADAAIAETFRAELRGARKVYDKMNLVGITAKFKVGNLEIPNLIFSLTRRLAYKNVNIIEVVSTATELTYIIEKSNLSAAIEQLQKDI